MLLHGTTTAEVKTGYGLDEPSELAMLDAIALAAEAQSVELVPTFMGGHLPAPGMPAEGYVQVLCENMIPSAARHAHRPIFNDVFCDEGAFTIEQSRAILEAGMANGLRPKIHAEELVWTGATRLGVSLGAVSVDHLLHVNDGDIGALAASDTVATLLPGTAFYLGLGDRPPARKMLEAGCVLALATDYNPGSSLIGSLPFVMGLGCLHLGLRANETLGAVTANAAAAVGLERTHGQLAPGYVGDAVIWDVPTLSALVGGFVGARAHAVVKRGVVRVPRAGRQ
jgi:imidazolonepropionase